MCGRIIQASGPLRYQLVDGLDVQDRRLSNIPRRYNGAPGQELFIIRQNHETGERSLDLLKWGLIPSWINNPKGRPKPINAMAETVRSKPMFRDAYRKRRGIVPVDGFFEWQATRGGKQPYAIGMKSGAPFGLAGLWENWKDPATGEWVRTFTIITVPSKSNELITQIHDRMPAILAAGRL
jgi:putative SOS response-associated peptidase YedK